METAYPKAFLSQTILYIAFCFLFKVAWSHTDQTLWSFEPATAVDKQLCGADRSPHKTCGKMWIFCR